ncbi:YjbH domain-containing protein [Halomonadaceae bacterium KBTZ08]
MAISPAAWSGEPQTHTSFQGYSGLFNTPNARVAPYGEATLQYSDQLELAGRFRHGDNYILSLGLMPNAEINGRLATTSTHTHFFEPSDEPRTRDLSLNAKVQAPWIPEDWFQIAIGAQDPAGETQDFKAEYAVISRAFWNARLSAGVGRSDSALGRLDGAFGGAEWAAARWLDLVAEHDSQTLNAGLRLHHTARLWDTPVRFNLNVQPWSQEEGFDQSFFGASVSLPLGGGTSTSTAFNDSTAAQAFPAPAPGGAGSALTQAPPREQAADRDETDGNNQADQQAAATSEPFTPSEEATLEAIMARLSAQGFENIDIGVGADRESLYVRLENYRYNRNELDGLGIALGHVVEGARSHYPRVRLVLKNVDIPVMALEVPTEAYFDYMQPQSDGALGQPAAPRPPLRVVDTDTPDQEVVWYRQDYSSAALSPRFSFSLNVVSGVATELGVFDHSTALRTHLFLPLWQGGSLAFDWDTPLAESEDFQEGGFFQEQAIDAGLKTAFAQQALKLGPVYNQAHVGLYRGEFYGGFGESYWQPKHGPHRLKAKVGYFKPEKDNTAFNTREVALGSYRYYFAPLDAEVEVTGGQFWGQDQGVKVSTRHHFADTSVEVFVKDTDITMAGVRLTIPLGRRESMKPTAINVRGSERWSYSVATRINEDSNTLSFTAGDDPTIHDDLERRFFSDDRLHPSYMRRHLPRMREAFWRFGH